MNEKNAPLECAPHYKVVTVKSKEVDAKYQKDIYKTCTETKRKTISSPSFSTPLGIGTKEAILRLSRNQNVIFKNFALIPFTTFNKTLDNSFIKMTK